MKIYPNFSVAIRAARQSLITQGEWVLGDQWQSIDVSKKPEMAMREVLNSSFQVPMVTENLDYLREDIKPNLPWADDHFLERVGGQPLNPGVQWAHWPWGNSADTFRREGGQFSHTYMERIWPRWAGLTEGGRLPQSCGACGTPNANCDVDCMEAAHIGPHERRGIRYRYGDLNDLVNHLEAHPLTRQAYLPIWFPEDTGTAHGERVPCTLGYQFIQRRGFLHTTYYIRSCDAVRHFPDDIYLAVRLQLWILDRLRERKDQWKPVSPGLFTMHITSLHCFKNDYAKHERNGEWV